MNFIMRYVCNQSVRLLSCIFDSRLHNSPRFWLHSYPCHDVRYRSQERDKNLRIRSRFDILPVVFIGVGSAVAVGHAIVETAVEDDKSEDVGDFGGDAV
mmetsp:Transcript_23304/g.64662  ORF Transcript_23304/g.64662 Transcript_23304/m.64662 type:complete len:99 (-) Transcript_23304:1046-1342(-)